MMETLRNRGQLSKIVSIDKVITWHSDVCLITLWNSKGLELTWWWRPEKVEGSRQPNFSRLHLLHCCRGLVNTNNISTNTRKFKYSVVEFPRTSLVSIISSAQNLHCWIVLPGKHLSDKISTYVFLQLSKVALDFSRFHHQILTWW